LTALKAEKRADFFPPGLNLENLFILVSGPNAGQLVGLDTSLNDGDVVSILAPAFGGCFRLQGRADTK
jgi:molybdopterin converting factor small subunit